MTAKTKTNLNERIKEMNDYKELSRIVNRFEVQAYEHDSSKFGIWDNELERWYCFGAGDIIGDNYSNISKICSNLNQMDQYQKKNKNEHER